MLTFNEKVGQKYLEFITGQNYVIGSFRSNRFKILKKKTIDILFISHWRDKLDYMVTPTLSFKKWLSLHSFTFKKVYSFARSQNLHLVVYGKYKDEKEKNFFKNILGPEKNWSFYIITECFLITIVICLNWLYHQFLLLDMKLFQDLQKWLFLIYLIKTIYQNQKIFVGHIKSIKKVLFGLAAYQILPVRNFYINCIN